MVQEQATAWAMVVNQITETWREITHVSFPERALAPWE